MLTPQLPDNETLRQQEVDNLNLTNPELEECFNRITRLLAGLLEVPITAFSVIDKDRQYFKSSEGLSVRETPRNNSFCGHTILREDIFVVTDASADVCFADNPLVTDTPKIRFYAGIPIRGPGGQVVGSLCAIDTKTRELTRQMRQHLSDLRDIMEDELKLRSLINEDHLTGLLNRRCFEQTIEDEWRRSARALQALALLSIDVDHFKDYNDTYGHVTGDECLILIARLMEDACKRSADRVFRTGGEEFAILLPNTGEENALLFANRLRQAVIDENIEHSSAPAGKVTLSIGVCALEAVSGEESDLEAFIHSSDMALYEAKSRGRNTVVSKPFEIEPGMPEE